MRELATADRIREFMRRLGEAAQEDARVYLTGGATAVLLGWRESTLDVDIKPVPDRDELFRALPALKESLHLNVELASPDQFIPPLPDWESRSPLICRHGRVDWHHYDPHAQALAKIERDHDRDRTDVREMLRRGLIDPARLRGFFDRIRPNLIRYPAINPAAFARRVDEALSGQDTRNPPCPPN